jgi:hypothetical protein
LLKEKEYLILQPFWLDMMVEVNHMWPLRLKIVKKLDSDHHCIRFEDHVTEEELIAKMEQLNNDPDA